jgi:hypothetical protein
MVQPLAGALNWEMVFTDSAFAGASISNVSDTFVNGGLSFSLVGGVLNVTWAGDDFASDSDFSATLILKRFPSLPALLCWVLAYWVF